MYEEYIGERASQYMEANRACLFLYNKKSTGGLIPMLCFSPMKGMSENPWEACSDELLVFCSYELSSKQCGLGEGVTSATTDLLFSVFRGSQPCSGCLSALPHFYGLACEGNKVFFLRGFSANQPSYPITVRL